MPSTDPDPAKSDGPSAEYQRLESVTFRLSSGSAIEELPDCTLLFSETDQQIDLLNETSTLLARRMIAGGTAGELTRELVSLGGDVAVASQWVLNFLGDLSSRGILEVDEAPCPKTAIARRITVAGVDFSLRFSAPELEALVWPPFAHLESASEGGTHYDLFAAGDLVLIRRDDGLAMLVAKESAAIHLKSLILQEVLARADYLCALHAACISRDDATLLLLGPPGTGKTTLVLRLMSEGFSYCSDDVTLVHSNGQVTGLSFAPGIKEGSWDLEPLTSVTRDGVPIHVRPDGIRVRFLPIDEAPSSDPRSVSAIVRLHRSDDEEPRLTPLSSSEAVAEVLREARSTSGSCSVEIFQAITALVRDCRCFELRYSESEEVISLVHGQSYAST